MNTGFEVRVGKLEKMFEGFMEQNQYINQSLVAANQNALQMVQETNGKLAMQGKMMNTILHVQEEQEARMQKMEDRFEIHMANEMITPAQEKIIKKETFKRVCEFLQPDDVEWVLYSRAFFGSLYSFLRKDHYMMNPIGCTRIKNYDDVMEGIMAWYPNESEIREKADKRRNARKQASKM